MSRIEKHIVMLNEMQESLSDCAMRLEGLSDDALNDEYFQETKRDLISAMNNFTQAVDKL